MSLRFILFPLAVLGAGPYLGWLLADRIFGNAILVGPYLFASPLIAGTILAWSFWWFKRRSMQNQAVTDPALEVLANRIAQSLGLRRVRVFLQPDDEEERTDPVYADGLDLHISLGSWRRLDKSAQEFALANTLARKYPLWGKMGSYASIPTLVAAYMFAALNLWVILGLHTGSLLGWVYLSRSRVKGWTLECDRRAFTITGDLLAAERYIEATRPKFEAVEGITELRLASLRKLAEAPG